MRPATRVVGVGSPHGDDRIGWDLIEALTAAGPPAGVEAVCLRTPLDLLEHLDGCETLVVVDACRGGGSPGTIVEVDRDLLATEGAAGSSSHGLGLREALALAEALGRLPPRVIVFGVEMGPAAEVPVGALRERLRALGLEDRDPAAGPAGVPCSAR